MDLGPKSFFNVCLIKDQDLMIKTLDLSGHYFLPVPVVSFQEWLKTGIL